MGYKNIILEIDSLIVANMLITNMICLPLLSTLIDDCKELLKRPWRVIPRHIYREGNICADFLANKGRNQKENLRTYVLCPSFLSGMLGT